ncbi:MAG: DNA/RNA non-specific endonuclease, partial [Mucilaginibacter sp.]
MNLKSLIVFLGCALLISSCIDTPKNNTQYHSLYTAATPVVPIAQATPYTLTETFENGKKAKYSKADISLTTGSWTFDDAIIGKQKTDAKIDNAAARIRNGAIIMNFDVYDVTQVTIKHAKYKTDKASAWQLMLSVDSGKIYTQVGNYIQEDDTTLKTDSFKINITGRVRFKIIKSGTARINIDDFTFQGIGDPGIIAGMADTVKVDTSLSKIKSKSRGVIIGPDAPPAAGD